jgi:hypothetical protein
LVNGATEYFEEGMVNGDRARLPWILRTRDVVKIV